jgi:hypothetical protein
MVDREQDAFADRKVVGVGQMKAPAEISLAQPTIEESVQNLGADRMQPFRQAGYIGSLGGFCGSP